MSELTPMMRQYHQIKENYPGTVLFFRLGDFYEMFDTDAVEVSQLLGLTLTQRNGVPMCGIPYHASEMYLKRLLQSGMKVAVCEQVLDSTKTQKGLFERRVTEVLTPGTLTRDEFLEPKEASYVACFFADGTHWSSVFCELSTGDLWAGDFHDSGTYPELERVIERFRPREIVVVENFFESYPDLKKYFSKTVIEEVPLSWFKSEVSANENDLRNLLENFSYQEVIYPPLRAIGRYITKVQGHPRFPIYRYHSLFEKNKLIIDSSSIRNLELLANYQGEKTGSLVEVLDKTLTPAGSRYLKQELLAPSCLKQEVEKKLSLTNWFYQHSEEMKFIRHQLRGLGDIERILIRLSLDKASPYDLLALGEIIERSLTCLNKIESLFPLDINKDQIQEISNIISKSIHPDASKNIQDSPRINEHFNDELDRWRDLSTKGEESLEKIRKEDASRYGLPLKLKYNQVLGYFYELTKLQATDVPPGMIRRQSLVNAERFTTETLLQAESELKTSKEKSEQLDLELFLMIRSEIKNHLIILNKLSDWLRNIDYHQSLAQVARDNHWSCPSLVENPVLHIKNGRHPVIEKVLPPGEFIPNDLDLTEDSFFRLVTGPNMAGKSTFLRQNALILLLAHLGSFVPADQAEIGIADKIFCRVGAYDRLFLGDSTFMVEMKETAHILRNATNQSLIIMDEVGRGTSTHDGLALAWSISEYLLKITKARTLFSTHYHELTQLEHPALENLHMEVKEKGGDVQFLRRAVRGTAKSSYGIYAAKLAGIPEVILLRAEQLLIEHRAVSKNSAELPSFQITELFSPLELIGSEIISLNLDKISPKEALDLLYKIQAQYQRTKTKDNSINKR